MQEVLYRRHDPSELREWDESKHPRVPAGSPEGGQFGEGGGGASESIEDERTGKRFLITHHPSDETLHQWQDQLMAEAAKEELGGLKDDELQKMIGAISLYGRMPKEFESGGARTLSAVYDLDKKLLAVVASRIDRETKVAEVTFGGGTDPDAMVKALTMAIADHEKEAERIEATDWTTSLNNESYVKAGFRREGEPSFGVQRFVWGKSGETTGQQAKRERETREHSEKILGASQAAARLLGYDPKLVSVSDEDATFKIGSEDKVRHAAGLAALDGSGRITMFPRVITNADAAVSVMAHEVEHQKYERVINAYIAERRLIETDIMREPPNTVMALDGSLKPPYDKKYPLYARMQKHDGGEALERRIKTDGITDYSRAYWEQAKPEVPAEKQVSLHLAQHETLAEIARRATETGKIEGSPAWRAYYRDVNKSYDELKALDK